MRSLFFQRRFHQRRPFRIVRFLISTNAGLASKLIWLFFVYHAFFIVPLEFGNFVFWGERKPRIPREKSLGAENRNKIYNPNPRMTSLPVFESRPHWWEASAVIILHQPCFPSLLKLRTIQCVQYCMWSWGRGWTCCFWLLACIKNWPKCKFVPNIFVWL